MRIPAASAFSTATTEWPPSILCKNLDIAEFEKINKKKPEVEQEVWIGTHSDDEVPN
jgi:hypothetical protein